MKKALSATLALLTLGSLAACGGGNTAAETTAAIQTAPAETTAPDDRLFKNTTPELLHELGLDGYKFTVMMRNGWGCPEFKSEEMTGEILNDAIYERNGMLEDQFGFSIVQVDSTARTTPEMEEAILAGDNTYDASFSIATTSAKYAQNGYVHALNKLKYLEADGEEWDNIFNEGVTYCGNLYFGAGYLSINILQSPRCFFFNKNMLDDLKLDDPYALVLDGKWTIDVFDKMAKSAARDLNGDGVMDMTDCLGMSWQNSVGGNVFFNGANGNMVTKDPKTDTCVYTLGDEYTTAVCDKIRTVINDANTYKLADDNTNMTPFKENRALFATGNLSSAVGMRDLDIEFGILPTPKYNEEQDHYCQFVDDWCTTPVQVPITAKDKERCGYILQVIAETGKEYIWPAYYDIVLTGKTLRDQESEAMLDILATSAKLDPAVIYNWGNLMRAMLAQLNTNEGLASFVASNRETVNAAIAATNEAFLKLAEEGK